MKKIAIIITLITLSLSSIYGQTDSNSNTNTITMEREFGSYVYYQGEKEVNLSQLVEIMKPNELAYEQIKSAKAARTASYIFAFTGGFLVGWPAGIAFRGGNPDWRPAILGGSLIIASFAINYRFNKKTRQAIRTYNGGLKTSSFSDRSELRFSMSGNGGKIEIADRISEYLKTGEIIKAKASRKLKLPKATQAITSETIIGVEYWKIKKIETRR